MTDEEKLAVLRSLKLGHDKEWMTKPLKEALEWAIQCCDAVQMLEEWIDCGDIDPDKMISRVRALMESK